MRPIAQDSSRVDYPKPSRSNVYQPEKLASWNWGPKTASSTNRLQVNLSAYRWRYKDLQDSRVNFDPLGKCNFSPSYLEMPLLKWYRGLDRQGDGIEIRSLSTEYANSHYTFVQLSKFREAFFDRPVPAATSRVPTHPARRFLITALEDHQRRPLPIVVVTALGFKSRGCRCGAATVGYDHVFDLSDGASLRAGDAHAFCHGRVAKHSILSLRNARRPTKSLTRI